MELRTTFSDLKCKEVINVCDGGRLGCVSDLELDLCTGTILSIIVPGERSMLGLLRARDGLVIPLLPHTEDRGGRDTGGSEGIPGLKELLIACLQIPL